MKKLVFIFGILFLASYARAAVTFSISTAAFVTDSTQGTFVVNTTTFGALVGVQYGIHAVDGATGAFADRFYEFAITPRTSFPSAALIRAAIQADVIARDPRAGMLAVIIQKNNDSTRAKPLIEPNVPGVDGTVVTPP